MFNYYKLLRRYNTLKLKYNQLENLVKTNCFNQLLKKLGEPYEIERLREENTRLRIKIRELKQVISKLQHFIV